MRLDRTTDLRHLSSDRRGQDNGRQSDVAGARRFAAGGAGTADPGSVLVGVILSVLGLDPFDIVRSPERLIRWLWDMGFDAFHWLWRYFLLGAVIVVPIWLIMRLVNGARGS